MFKKWDIIIIIVLMIVSFIPEIAYSMISNKNYNAVYAEVTVDGKPYKKYRIDNHKGNDEHIIKTKYGINILKIEDDKVAIIEADCPDKVCIKPGFIKKPGQTLVCLPHRVVVEIKGMTKDADEPILSY